MSEESKIKNKVVTRIAPSPTGLFHIGTARSALFNYLYAKKYDGVFVVRVEDTDKQRSKKEYEKDILQGLTWLGYEHDKLERQSERTDVYIRRLKEIVDNNKAYISKEPAKDNEHEEVEVVRLKNPGKKVVFEDVVRGEIVFDTTELGDFVIARSMNEPLYHFAVVVDDDDVGVSHVIRGEDHISNTPRQILIQEALGIKRPVYAHLPLILAPDKSKMSKRKGAVSVSEYREMGFYPEAINNYIALLGWNPGDDREVFSMDELIEAFSLEHIQKGGAVFDIEKLKWIQKEHIKLRPKKEVLDSLKENVKDYEKIFQAVESSPSMSEDTLDRFPLKNDLQRAIEDGEFDYYEKRPEVEQGSLVWKKDSHPERVPERLKKVIELLEDLDTSTFTYDIVKDAVWAFAEAEGKGDVLWPMRYALSGKDRSPDPFLLAEALGREETITRLQQAVEVFT